MKRNIPHHLECLIIFLGNPINASATVLAPTNDAFEKAPKNLDTKQLKFVLQGHILNGVVSSSDALNAPNSMLRTLANSSVIFRQYKDSDQVRSFNST
jgi:uncharacterized surface protein with fasciclin (FAS1) repeats